MSHQSDYLLGRAFAVLSRIRADVIVRDDLRGLELIEDDYQEINQEIKNLYSANKLKETQNV